MPPASNTTATTANSPAVVTRDEALALFQTLIERLAPDAKGTPEKSDTPEIEVVEAPKTTPAHPMLGETVMVRTETAGVHFGKLVAANGREAYLTDAYRLWSWTGGGLSLSALANNGIKGGRINHTGRVYLTGAIEFIPVTKAFTESYPKFVES